MGRSSCVLGVCDGSGWILGPEDVARPCECRAQQIAKARSSGVSSVIPAKYRGASFERPPVTSIDAMVVRAVRAFCEQIEEKLDAGRGLWLMGDVGTGKTTLAMLVSRAALDAGHSVAIYSLPRLLAELRMTYDDESERSYIDLVDRLTAVDLLHIDDVGAERSSEWVLEQLYSIVNARYEHQRSIVVTTNIVERDELSKQITPRPVSRLTEMCEQLPLFGPDRRMDVRSA